MKLTTYAIVQTGGKQYRVQAGDTFRVESLGGADGDTVELREVLMVSQDGEVKLGTPTLEGAKVTAEVVGSGKGKKIVVFKYKAKTRYRRKNGHRQIYTELKVTDISA
jgi:large subunit ribosomal protein L21